MWGFGNGLEYGQVVRYRDGVMSTVQEIEEAIKALPREQFSQLWQWWDEYREAEWDRQIEADAQAGKLDRFIEEALEEHRQGKTRPLP